MLPTGRVSRCCYHYDTQWTDDNQATNHYLYLMQASSEATQQRDGELAHVAILFTLFWQHDHTCMYTLQRNDNHFLSRQLRSSHYCFRGV